MIDRTLLTDALDGLFDHNNDNTVTQLVHAQRLVTVMQAARILLDFPTDEMVKVAEATYNNSEVTTIRDVLEAVRRVIFDPDE